METTLQQPQQVSNPTRPTSGIIKQWNEERGYGIIYSPEGARYFLHRSKVVEGTPEMFRRVTFTIGEKRRPEELAQALNVHVGEKVSRS